MTIESAIGKPNLPPRTKPRRVLEVEYVDRLEASTRARDLVKKELRERFAEFLDGSPGTDHKTGEKYVMPGGTHEEIRFLVEVFRMWESATKGDEDQIGIATAFQFELQRDRPCVMLVPEDLVNDVRAFVKWREQGGPAAA
jgi:hypothetical protein